MKTLKLKLTLIFIATSVYLYGQQQEVNFLYQNINLSAPPRSTLSPMSIKLWDSYLTNGPTSYGTVLEFYGLNNHQTGQFYCSGWDNSKIRYREAFCNQNTWSDWMTLLDSKNNVNSTGLLEISGTGNHYISNGNLGIGTLTPHEKLSVNGKIRAHEVKVETDNWPDYVFDEGYEVGTLEALESYIRRHKHLPEILSAEEAERNGIELGELNKALLKKIEELTLYLIEKDKQLKNLTTKVEKQDIEQRSLLERIIQLENSKK